jgi:AcrR family transcriptional regulator
MKSIDAILDRRQEDLSERQERILDAAEACCVSNGFHRTTMQDIARAATMSPANIYRYFDSKEAVILGMAMRERWRASVFIAELNVEDDRAALLGIITKYHLGISREAAVLRLELWSEASRNPAIAKALQQLEAESRAWFVEKLEALATSPDCDSLALSEAISSLLKGLVVNLALLTDYDRAPAAAQLRAILEAGLAGRLPTAVPPP